MKFSILVLAPVLLLASFSAAAVCPKHEPVDQSRVQLSDKPLLIVTHAASNDDGRAVSKIGVDAAIRFARDKRFQRVYLQDERPPENYFMDDCEPDYWVKSAAGEISFDVTPAQVYTVGGHLEICLSHTLHDVLQNWARKPARDLTITYFMDAIFSNGELIDEDDPYYQDYRRFMSVVTYGRPGGEHFPKLSLLETMGIIIKPAQQIAYLERVLPQYRRTMPKEYRVELLVNDAMVKVLQTGTGRRAPVLRFHFVDSAIPAVQE